MDLLIVDSLEAEWVDWLRRRYSLRRAPELAFDRRAFLRAIAEVRSIIVPASVAIDDRTLRHAPRLRAVGRISAGDENIDLDACARAGVEIVRGVGGTARAEAEFMTGALLTMLRRIPVKAAVGPPAGRELGAATVGLVGLTPAARALARLLPAFGSTLVGYDPAVHGGESVWGRWKVKPLGLQQLFEQADAVCVQLGYVSRYRGLIGARVLGNCKPNQVLVSIGHAGLIDAEALADALRSSRLAAAWLDDADLGDLRPGQPLAGLANLQITPRLASTTGESRRRCAWAVVERIDQLLDSDPAATQGAFKATRPGDPTDPEAGSP